MYNYKVGYGTYEESEFFEFSHEKKLTHKELMKCFEIALTNMAIKTVSNPEEQWRFNPEDDTDPLGLSYQDMMYPGEDFIKEMEKQGFTKVQYQESVCVFGWGNAFVNDWKSCRNDEEKEMGQRISEKCKSYLNK